MGVTYWPERDEIYVAHHSGVISVYNASSLEKGPIRKLWTTKNN